MEGGKVPSVFDLTGQRAIVTGASRGLGRHFALTLARAGAQVALAARGIDRLEVAVKEIEGSGGCAVAIQVDVTDGKSVKRCVETAENALGPINILVNNAGIAVTKPLLEHAEEDWDSVLDTNLKGIWLMAQEVARRMIHHRQDSSIINIASVLGERGIAQLPGYCASKGGIINLTRAMAVELAPHGIRINTIAPGYIETDMNRQFFATQAGQRLIKRIPQRRLGQVEDLEGVLLLLASSASRYMTGSVITIDGGQSISL
ncbi:2-deoxy-D-gluconate 3-dehydrogenase [Candidatus Poribacteria bacterium]|nr:MAG: 2-deoxy-D-gluconate 3-dehydrogenase [Candidatus Poribacteria bacterium]